LAGSRNHAKQNAVLLQHKRVMHWQQCSRIATLIILCSKLHIMMHNQHRNPAYPSCCQQRLLPCDTACKAAAPRNTHLVPASPQQQVHMIHTPRAHAATNRHAPAAEHKSAGTAGKQQPALLHAAANTLELGTLPPLLYGGELIIKRHKHAHQDQYTRYTNTAGASSGTRVPASRLSRLENTRPHVDVLCAVAVQTASRHTQQAQLLSHDRTSLCNVQGARLNASRMQSATR
jgi:hypothetical protein